MAFFNDDEEDESYKPPQKGMGALANQNNLVNAYNNAGATKGVDDVKKKFSNLFGDEDDEEEY